MGGKLKKCKAVSIPSPCPPWEPELLRSARNSSLPRRSTPSHLLQNSYRVWPYKGENKRLRKSPDQLPLSTSGEMLDQCSNWLFLTWSSAEIHGQESRLPWIGSGSWPQDLSVLWFSSVSDGTSNKQHIPWSSQGYTMPCGNFESLCDIHRLLLESKTPHSDKSQREDRCRYHYPILKCGERGPDR